MVGVIILYDHVHPVGAFAKSSNIDVSSNTFTSEYACINLFSISNVGFFSFQTQQGVRELWPDIVDFSIISIYVRVMYNLSFVHRILYGLTVLVIS